MWCLFNAVEMEKCSSYNDNYYCFGIMFKKATKKQEKCVVECCTDSTRDVVFFKESTNLSDGPFYSSQRQMGIKQPANQSRCLMIEIFSVMTDFQNKPLCISSVLLWRFECKKAAFDSNSIPKFLAQKKNLSERLKQHMSQYFYSFEGIF